MTGLHIIEGPEFRPRPIYQGRHGVELDMQPFLASCSCGEQVRSERREVVAQWVAAHRENAGASCPTP